MPVGRPIQALPTPVTKTHKFPFHYNLASRTYIKGDSIEERLAVTGLV
jgi:hypothetical protein